MKKNKKYTSLQKIEKRDGSIVPFDQKHIKRAILRAMEAVKEGDEDHAENVMYKVLDDLIVLKKSHKKSKEFKNAMTVLNYLEKCFPSKPGNYKHFEKHAWVFAVYTMIRELKLSHSLIGQEDKIKDFIVDFHSKVYNEDFRKSKVNYQRFYDNVRGGWSEKIIALRRDILIKEFITKNKLLELDDKRQISDEQKIAIFATRKNCERCSCAFKDYKEAEYHHKDRYADGGKSRIENIMILCSKCHDIIHGSGEIIIPTEEEATEPD